MLNDRKEVTNKLDEYGVSKLRYLPFTIRW